MDLRDLINNLPAKSAFPSPRMPAVIKEFSEGHGTAAAWAIHRALTIHMNLLNEAPRPQAGASRARSGEQEASKGNFLSYCAP